MCSCCAVNSCTHKLRSCSVLTPSRYTVSSVARCNSANKQHRLLSSSFFSWYSCQTVHQMRFDAMATDRLTTQASRRLPHYRMLRPTPCAGLPSRSIISPRAVGRRRWSWAKNVEGCSSCKRAQSSTSWLSVDAAEVFPAVAYVSATVPACTVAAAGPQAVVVTQCWEIRVVSRCSDAARFSGDAITALPINVIHCLSSLAGVQLVKDTGTRSDAVRPSVCIARRCHLITRPHRSACMSAPT